MAWPLPAAPALRVASAASHGAQRTSCAPRNSSTARQELGQELRQGAPPPPLFAFFLPLSHVPVPIDVAGLGTVGEVARAATRELALAAKLGRAVTAADVRLFIISREEAKRLLAANSSRSVPDAEKGEPLGALDSFDAVGLCEGSCLLVELALGRGSYESEATCVPINEALMRTIASPASPISGALPVAPSSSAAPKISAAPRASAGAASSAAGVGTSASPFPLPEARQMQLTPSRLVELEAALPPGLLGSPSRAPHVIISAYDEDLEWIFGIAAVGWEATVYHKHPQRAAAFRDAVSRRGAPGIQVLDLENWGDEALPYLRFIVDNFDALPRATAFLHGSAEKHAPFLLDMLRCLDPEWTRVARTPNFDGTAHGYFSLNNQYIPGRDMSHPLFLPATKFINEALEARGVAVRIREPGVLSFYCCAQFLATPLAFLRLGRAFWEVMRDAALLHLPNGGVRKSTAVYFEHIWHELLGQKQHLERVLAPPADVRKAPFLPRCYVSEAGEETPFARFIRLEFR